MESLQDQQSCHANRDGQDYILGPPGNHCCYEACQEARVGRLKVIRADQKLRHEDGSEYSRRYET